MSKSTTEPDLKPDHPFGWTPDWIAHVKQEKLTLREHLLSLQKTHANTMEKDADAYFQRVNQKLEIDESDIYQAGEVVL